jgi:hypothetical protein
VSARWLDLGADVAVEVAVAGYEMGVADVFDDVVRPRVLRDSGPVHRIGAAFLTTVFAERLSPIR